MQPLAHDQGATGIGAEVIAIGSRGLAVGAAAGTSTTVLLPAGSDEVSLQAALAFAAEGGQVQIVNALAQEELARAGAAYVEASGIYAVVDDSAATTLM